ncbi:type I-C CRISPR-associated protein Cas8c/Csd1 [Delftia acidovorans]|uniref:type I-C CRISPR-associated protein Cas8c/Csd1 n=1 Tax=Delftia acidovorans TaxID=80866 RepID=UPI003015C1B3
MILQALATYYQRLLERREEGLAPFGYSPEKISYEILLAADGRVVQVNDIRDTTGKKPLPCVMNVPQPEKRTVGIKSNFLWDKTSYVLGVSATSKRADKEHEAFKALHREHLAGTQDAGLKALLGFFDAWTPQQFEAPHFNADMLDANMVFRMDGEKAYLHERPAAQALRARLLASDDSEESGQESVATCLVSGESLPVARLHPVIKGVSGAQSSGASIVSFNQESFTSYGKSQGDNAPVSEQAAFAYTTVLNHLLRRGEHNRQRLQIGDTSIVFWAEAADGQQAEQAESLLADLLDDRPSDDQEAARIRIELEKVQKGRPLSDIDPRLQEDTRMYVLGLAPNASRISIRFWEVGTLGLFARRLAEHADDFALEPRPWKTAPSAYRVVLATAPHREGSAPKMDDAMSNLVGEFMRAVLTGRPYPRSLLANVLMRMRSDGHLSGLRVGICKGILARERRLGINSDKEEIPVSLDKESTNPAYRLGRLFAVLESIQRQALGEQINATIRDRYYGAASATPASVFPMLLRNAQNHLSKALKDKKKSKLAGFFEGQIREILDGLSDSFPRSFNMQEQGRFAIGYYHQQASRKPKDTAEQAADSDTDSTEDTSEEASA